MNDLLQQGIASCKAGKRDEARRIFLTAVKQNPDSEGAWGWMSNVCHTDQERIHCLKQILRINPGNEKARQSLDRLLAPPFPSELPLASGPSVPLPAVFPAGKSGSKNASFTGTQLFILLGLVVAIFLIFGFALLYMGSERDQVAVALSPTSFVPVSASTTLLPTEVLPTATAISTYAYAPTWTPLPSPTSFVLPTLVLPTSKPPQAQSNPAPVNPPAGNSSSNCPAQLEYAAAMHRYYLDQIEYIHAPLISLYQSWIDQASRDRDALALVQAQRALENERAQVDAEKASENQRYKAEIANIYSGCQ